MPQEATSSFTSRSINPHNLTSLDNLLLGSTRSQIVGPDPYQLRKICGFTKGGFGCEKREEDIMMIEEMKKVKVSLAEL